MLIPSPPSMLSMPKHIVPHFLVRDLWLLSFSGLIYSFPHLFPNFDPWIVENLKLYNGCSVQSLSAVSWVLFLEGTMKIGFVTKSEIIHLFLLSSEIVTYIPCSLIEHRFNVLYYWIGPLDFAGRRYCIPYCGILWLDPQCCWISSG